MIRSKNQTVTWKLRVDTNGQSTCSRYNIHCFYRTTCWPTGAVRSLKLPSTRQCGRDNSSCFECHRIHQIGRQSTETWWLGGVMLRTLNFRSKGVQLPAWSLSSAYYLDEWLSVDRKTIAVYKQTNTKVNSAFYPSGVRKLSISLISWG